MADVSCPTCGKKFGAPQGLGVHRAKVHGYRSTEPQTIAARERKRRAAANAKVAAKSHMTTVQWTELIDDNGSGRRLFVDENNDWWVAKKLDF